MLREALALSIVSREDQIMQALTQAWDERLLNGGPRPTAPSLAEKLEVPERTISSDVRKLVGKKMIVRAGSGAQLTIMPMELYQKMARAVGKE